MIFETLYESAQRGELLLVEGGICNWHLRRDGVLVIYEIISTQKGAGIRMLNTLRETPGARCIFAKCPVDLVSNIWYARRGFRLVRVETTKSGRALNCWEMAL